MSATTSIEWTDRTWNPTTGCDKVSPGCAHCYAETIAKRLWPTSYPPVECAVGDPRVARRDAARRDVGFVQPGQPGLRFRDFTDVQTHEDRLLEPLSWRKPSRIFVNSMSDLFHEGVPDEFIDKVFAVMGLAPQHTFQILTKRPERMRDYMIRLARHIAPLEAAAREMGYTFTFGELSCLPWPIPNVWLGVSVENQQYADERIPLLLQTPAAVRFISAEPLLGPVTLREHLMAGKDPGRCANCGKGHGFTRCPNYGGISPTNDESGCTNFKRANFTLDWVIVGGESGQKARPFDVAWGRSIVAQCKAAGVPCFVKQLGRNPISTSDIDHGLVDLDDRKGGDMAEWPPDLQVRQFPEVRA